MREREYTKEELQRPIDNLEPIKDLEEFYLQFRCAKCNFRINSTIFEYDEPKEYKIYCPNCEKKVLSKVVKVLKI